MSGTQALLPFERLKREILVKREADTSEKFGCMPKERSTEDHIRYGIVNINKPKGPTSHQVSAYIQKMLELNKAGHSGTLDPKVTGVLPIALGKATKIVQALLPAGKEYVCIMHLHKLVDEEKIRETCKEFIGKIKQLPPIKSAVKRKERFRKIYYLEILEIEEQDVLFKVGCQAGTYIRKLCFNIGQRLGTGAHMHELIRTKAGPFNESAMVTMQDLQDAYWYYKNKKKEEDIRKVIQPMESAVEHLPKIWILDTTVNTICHGANLKVPGISKLHSEIQKDDLIAVMTLKNELVALAKAKMTTKEIIKKDRGVAASLERVFMERNTYPKIEK